MSLDQLWRRLVRRPGVLALILVIASIFAALGWTTAQTETISTANILVSPPWKLDNENIPNPMLNLGDRATSLANVLALALQSDEVVQFAKDGGAQSYTVSNLAPDSVRDPVRFPVLQLSVTGKTEDAARTGALRLIDRAGTLLKDMQLKGGVDEPRLMATIQVITPPEQHNAGGSRQVRAAASWGIAGLLAGILLFFAYESAKDRREHKSEETDEGTASTDPNSTNDALAADEAANPEAGNVSGEATWVPYSRRRH